MAESYVHESLTIEESAKLFSKVLVLICISSSRARWIHLLYRLTTTWYSKSISIFNIRISNICTSNFGVNVHLLDNEWCGLSFNVLIAIHISFLLKYLLIFCLFTIGLFIFEFCGFCMYSKFKSYQTWFVNIFSHSMACLHSLNSVISTVEIVISDEVQ